MKKYLSFVFIIIVPLSFITFCQTKKSETGLQKIVFIRHGEKPDKGDNLSCQGLNRSIQLANVLHEKIGEPNSIFVPSLDLGRKTNGARMYQTVIPYAVKYNLTVNTKYDADDIDGITKAIQKQSGTVLLVWEHKALSKIVAALGVTNAGKWDDADFDSMWIITYKNGTPVFSKETEGIHPSQNCP